MRSSADMSSARIRRPRRRVVLLSILATVVVVIIALKILAGLYIDSLWYSSIGQHDVFSTVLETKIGLFLTFGLIFFLAMWANLLLCNRLGPSELFLDAPEDELVRRFQGAVRPYAGRLYALLSFVLALIAASSTIGRWQEWLLFSNSQSFGMKDPLFGLDYSWYIFRLPFITFVVDWVLASLLAIIIFTAIFHYLNGGIRGSGGGPRVSPGVKVHLSVLIALLALAKAAGYLVARWHLVTSTTNGVVEGAGYTDVHVRMPALMLLFWLCLAAAVILLVNIRQRGWTLPVIAVGLWAFVALLVGVIYPAIIQAAKVTPAQSSLEKPYIERNIQATRAAYNLTNVPIDSFQPTSKTPVLQQPGVAASLADVRAWDPSALISQNTFQQTQDIKNYYSISSLGEDRYVIDGKLTPVIEGIRELNTSGVPNSTWVNLHLQYTHGLGVVMAPSNKVFNGQPAYTELNVPPASAPKWPPVIKPQIYFGLNQNGYVVVDTKQPELDYESHGAPTYQDYTGDGGVQMGGLFRRLLFAIRFGDPNLLLSSDIHSTSQIIFMRNVVQIAQHAAPFLSIDDHPYAVIDNGHLDWVLDGYTTTDQYPYSQNASSELVPSDTGLPSSYNYVRNSVKIVIDAYSGQVTLYAMTTHDPILNAWESAFPNLILPIGQMESSLRAHLKYPQDIFSIQTAIFGRYHLTKPSSFYNNGGGWSITPTDGAGPPSDTIQLSTTYDRNGYPVSTTVARMDPLYQVYALPGSAAPQYTLTDAYVTASAATQGAATTGVLNLTAFMVAQSDPKDYGDLRVYQPANTTTGPVQADSQMSSYPPASKEISYLGQIGSKVYLGNVLMVPINGSLLYVRPMYVSASSNSYPLLKFVIAVYKHKTGFASSMGSALTQVLSGGPASTTGPTTATENQLIAEAANAYVQALAALKAGGPDALGKYQHFVTLQNKYILEAQQLESSIPPK